ncbi:MAG TPA: type II toxin-antitoxin system RelE/ParE family toxin [Caulobacterales bacterium]|nr:type II toxin-antitoxin system RelE/ParE family toxin [Caulobacterales bacterium]
MNRLIVSPQARRDIADILRTSARRFGVAASRRYHHLITQAQKDLVRDATRPGVQTRGQLRLYHLRFARNHTKAEQHVGAPRHLLVFRLDSTMIEVVRVLHDSMDIEAHLETESGNDN